MKQTNRMVLLTNTLVNDGFFPLNEMKRGIKGQEW